MTHPLVKKISQVAGAPASVRIGVIETVNPVTVRVQETVFDDVGVVDGYFPAVGDVVSLLGQSSSAGTDPTSWLVLGSASPGSTGLATGIQAGQVSLSFGPATSFTQLVTFATPYATAPNVMTNIASGAGSTAGWGSRAITVNATDFTLFVFGASSTWVGIPVQWNAIPRNQ